MELEDSGKNDWFRKSMRVTQENTVIAVKHHTKPIFDPYTMNIEGPKYPDVVPCFIEVSKNSRNKYEWDHDL